MAAQRRLDRASERPDPLSVDDADLEEPGVGAGLQPVADEVGRLRGAEGVQVERAIDGKAVLHGPDDRLRRCVTPALSPPS